MLTRAIGIGAALVLALCANWSLADDSASGTVIAVVQQASVDGQTGKRVLSPAAPVFSGDRIETGPIGTAQVRFRDDTKLVVGPNSSMVIDAFVFNANNTGNKISINVVKGAFRFITGKSPKNAYSITTPTATIGVRGTEFDISIEREGTTRIANYEGMTRICRKGGASSADCIESSEACSVSVIRPTEDHIAHFGKEDAAYRNQQLEYYFPYARSQDDLLKDFQVDLDPCHLAGDVRPESSPSAPGAPPPNNPGEPPPTPPAPTAPTFDAPAPPTPGDQHEDRPTYDHGGAFR
jgi:hypothetical protein